MRALELNKVRVNTSQRQVEALKEVDEPLQVPITPMLVIFTVIKDQILMPFIQGFAMTSVVFLCRPILYKVFDNGRRLGIRVFNSMRGQRYSHI